jgi:hypothetical protein
MCTITISSAVSEHVNVQYIWALAVKQGFMVLNLLTGTSGFETQYRSQVRQD